MQRSSLRGSIRIEHTLARLGAARLWSLMTGAPYVHALGAVTGNQAMQMVRAGLQAIYCSGWQVAADANLQGQTYPDQSLYPANSVPALVKRLNQALQRADQIEHAEGGTKRHDAALGIERAHAREVLDHERPVAVDRADDEVRERDDLHLRPGGGIERPPHEDAIANGRAGHLQPLLRQLMG